MVTKSKSCQIVKINFHTSLFESAENESDFDISRIYIKNLSLGNLVLTFNFHQIFWKICTLVNLKIMNRNLTGFSFSQNLLSILANFT